MEEASSPEDSASVQDDLCTFFTIKKNNGRESHHFQCGLFRFDRRKVKPSGAGYFYCSERTCKAAIRVNYVEENEEPSDIHVTNSKHNHQPDITMNYVVHCKRMIRDAIEKDPIEPVLKIYEEQVAKMMEDIRISGDSLVLEDFLILCNTMHYSIVCISDFLYTALFMDSLSLFIVY